MLGLCAFEVISSIDNAVINAQVLGTMKDEKAKKFFLTWGIFFAIFVVRGFLPFVIFFLANSQLGITKAMSAMWHNDPAVHKSIEASAPLLLMGGGIFLVILCLHWLFMEEKEFGLPHEQPMQKFGAVWFYAVVSLVLLGTLILIKQSVDEHHAVNLMLAATIGACVFFVTDGFKQNAEAMEHKMIEEGGISMTDWSKVMYLEVIDVTFSIDGVVGAFAFTLIIPLILIGNGIGAVVVRQLTVSNVERIKNYPYLKNGAMYSVGFLGTTMLLEAFHVHIPNWISPLATFGIIGFFLYKSIKYNQNIKQINV